MTDFKLTPAPVPPREGGGRPAVYSQMIAKFVEMGEPSVLVEYPRKVETVYNGLATALRKHPEFRGIAVTRRHDAIYLVHKK